MKVDSYKDYIIKYADLSRPLSGILIDDFLSNEPIKHVIGDFINNKDLSSGHNYSLSNATKKLFDFVLASFSFQTNFILVLEDALCRRFDQNLSTNEFKPIFFGDSEYVYWAKSCSSAKDIDSIFKHANGLPYFAFLFDSNIEELQKLFKNPSRIDFSTICKALIVGINDDERLLLLSKK